MDTFIQKEEKDGHTTITLFHGDPDLDRHPVEEITLHHGHSGRLYLETRDEEQTVLTPIPVDEELRYGPAIDEQGYIGLGRGTLLYRGPANMAEALFKAVLKQLTA